MGKSKSRILRKGINDRMRKINRSEAIHSAAQALNNSDIAQAKSYITMFGINAEELLEAGAGYETVVAINNILSL